MSIRELWRCCQSHAQAHKSVYHRAHNYSHLAYLGLVSVHGPYHVAALVSLLVVLVGFALKLEDL